MHIGFIEDTLLHGGTQIWVTEAVQYFLERGETVTVLTPGGGWVAGECAKTKARLITYDWNTITSKNAETKAKWRDALLDCDLAICTVHPPRDGFHCSIFTAGCIKEENLLTHLITKTGTIVPSYSREFYLPDESIQSSIIAITNFTRGYLIENYQIPEEKVSLIYQGTDTHRFRSSKKGQLEAFKRYPIPQNAAPILGCIGSLEHRKGQAVLFEAVSNLAGGPLPDIHLVLVGDGPDEQLLKDKAEKMGLAENISFFSFTREPEYIYERINMTVLPSLYKEGLPNVLLESMAMSVPVVASRLGGVTEAVIEGKTGYTVEPGNSDQLAEIIYQLWIDQLSYKRMMAYGRNYVVDKFNKNRQFNHFFEYFKKLS